MSIPHLIVRALAGTGKTHLLVQGTKKLQGTYKADLTIKPSQQQIEIWKQFSIGKKPSAVCLAAFSTAAKEEICRRMMPTKEYDVRTIHSLGLESIRNAVGKSGGVCTVDVRKMDHIIQDIHSGVSVYTLNRQKPGYITAVKELVKLAKYRGLLDVDDGVLSDLANEYGISTGVYTYSIFNIVEQVLNRCLEDNETIDFNDMVWIPIVDSLPVKRYDLLLVDEAQDLNHCQQQLALRSGERIIAVGDKHQAIYGFAGADTSSIETMFQHLSEEPEFIKEFSGCKVLPLTISRRCSQAVTEEARKIVPEFETSKQCLQGSVQSSPHFDAKPGDIILCRINAPLLGHALRLVSEKVPVRIIGQNVRVRLLHLIDILHPEDTKHLLRLLTKYREMELRKLEREKKYTDAAAIAIKDQCSCLQILCNETDSIGELTDLLKSLFEEKDEKTVRLSSIHRAKGLEAMDVYIVEPQLLPHPLAHSKWQLEQERNLEYVAITRCRHRLVYVESSVSF